MRQYSGKYTYFQSVGKLTSRSQITQPAMKRQTHQVIAPSYDRCSWKATIGWSSLGRSAIVGKRLAPCGRKASILYSVSVSGEDGVGETVEMVDEVEGFASWRPSSTQISDPMILCCGGFGR